MIRERRLRARLSPARSRILVLPVAAALVAAPLEAQGDPDFLFKRPRASLGFFGGWSVPQAGSDVFDFAREHLTVERSDFHGPALGGELAVLLTERLDLALTVGYSGSSVESEFRNWVEEGPDGSDVPILQTTRFRRIPATVSVKGYLWERGRTVSRFAWVPVTRWSPYLGAGAGWVWYSFVQEGDFVDFETLEIFSDRLESESSTPTAHVLAGAQLYLGPRLVLTGEGRYSWARTSMGGSDFTDFGKIDLSGVQLTAGIGLRF